MPSSCWSLLAPRRESLIALGSELFFEDFLGRGQQFPQHPSVFIGQRDVGFIDAAALDESLHPLASVIYLFTVVIDDAAGSVNQKFS